MIILDLRIKRLSNADKRICWISKIFTISVINIWSFGTTFWYFQNGNACYCGNTYKQTIRLKDSQCNRRCPGNKKQTCGGHGAISVYKGKKDWSFLLGWWCLTPLSAIFQSYCGSHFFFGGGNRSIRESNQILANSLTNFLFQRQWCSISVIGLNYWQKW